MCRAQPRPGRHRSVALLFAGVIATSPILAADSVVLGKGISNAYAADLMCAQSEICLDSVYVWEFDAERTVAGPGVSGRVRAVIVQHADATPEFVRSVRLFVVRPIEDLKMRETYDAQYRLLALSPLYRRGKYCLSVSPEEVGLQIAASQIEMDPDSDYYCFPRVLLR
jgi:hypothetical protein